MFNNIMRLTGCQVGAKLMHMKKRRKPGRKTEFAISKEQINYLRGMLMAKTGRDIQHKEFAKMLGISLRQFAYLKSGGRRPGKKTFDGIMKLRDYGIVVHMSDFEVKDQS